MFSALIHQVQRAGGRGPVPARSWGGRRASDGCRHVETQLSGQAGGQGTDGRGDGAQCRHEEQDSARVLHRATPSTSNFHSHLCPAPPRCSPPALSAAAAARPAPLPAGPRERAWNFNLGCSSAAWLKAARDHHSTASCCRALSPRCSGSQPGGTAPAHQAHTASTK